MKTTNSVIEDLKKVLRDVRREWLKAEEICPRISQD